MKDITLEYIKEATGGEICSGDAKGPEGEVSCITIDSRQIEDGSLFFAIIGERSDAHTFLDSVRESGCHNVVVSDREWADRMKAYGDMNVVLVEDTTRALIDFTEKLIDDKQGLRKIGVTGSVGKTSTKEFIFSIFDGEMKAEKTKGNFNSEYGVPLMVSRFPEDTELAVIEMGAGPGSDMADMARMIKPDAAVITIVGTSHLEAFGTRERLAEEKLKVASCFGEGGTLVINTDCDMLEPGFVKARVPKGTKLITVGSKGGEDYTISAVKDNGIDGVSCVLTAQDKEYEMTLPIIGAHNLLNAAEAVAIAGAFGIDTQKAVSKLAGAETVGKRLDVIKCDRYTVINDTYNASPESMKAGINVLMNSPGERKVAVLGSMFELGDNSENLHRTVGEYALDKGVDVVVTIGGNAKAIAEGAGNPKAGAIGQKFPEVFHFEDREKAIDAMERILTDGDLILVKASRGMELEKLVEAITEQR